MNNLLAPGSQLAQVTPASAADVTAFTATLRTVITSIFVTPITTAGIPTFRIYHDDDGTTYSTATALYYNNATAAGVTQHLKFGEEVDGLTILPGGSIGVGTSIGSNLTFTLYGVVQVAR
jgi:hypothetical protein